MRAPQETLRLLAFALMVFDHVAALWLTDWVWRIPGRVVFPIFALLLALHLPHTPLVKYLRRSGLPFLVAQGAYGVLFPQNGLNILFTLMAGAVLGKMYLHNPRWSYPALALAAVVSMYLTWDYGLFGVLLPVAMLERLQGRGWILSGLTLISGIFCGAWMSVVFGFPMLLGLMRLPLAKTPRMPTWLRWWFYPGHLWVLTLILAALS